MKVLVISHTPISNQNNMGKTFRTMFSAFDRSELCQLYIYPSYPDEPYCSSFYRVTDKEMLKSLRPGSIVDEQKIHKDQKLYERAADEVIYRNVKNKSPLRRLGRDLIWQSGRWYNHKLKAWLEQEKPTCIFLAPGPARFIYSIALKIAKERKIPIITYICDEYYFVKDEKTLLGKLRLGLLKRKIEQLMAHTSHIFAISEESRKLYSETFSVPASLCMTGSQKVPAVYPSVRDEVRTLAYFGNIRINRYHSLAEIGRALDSINAERGSDVSLEIYTGEKDPIFLSVFEGIRSVRLHGFLTGPAFDEAMQAADVLVHTEAFDEDSIDRVRHSVSTKIADSLAGGTPLFAYGPDCVSSMRHLIDHRCAITATAQKDLQATLCRLLDDRKLREESVWNALETARLFHSTEQNSQHLYETLQNLQG